MSVNQPNSYSDIVNEILNDNSKFSTIVDDYQKQLFVYIIKYIQDTAIAEDIVQEAFIKMYINLNSYDQNRPFSAWAYRITHNEMVNYLRKHKQTTELNEEAQYDELFDDRDNFLEEIDKKIQASQVRTLLYNLPMKYREILILHYFEQLDYQSIGTVINIPTSTVGTRIRRAKQQLHKIYIKEYGNEQ